MNYCSKEKLFIPNIHIESNNGNRGQIQFVARPVEGPVISMAPKQYTVKSLYNALFGVHRNGPCYKLIML